jgi:CheY-like chemotaxis protein
MGFDTVLLEHPNRPRGLAAQGGIDLLLTDMVLPGGMNGADIAALAVEACADLEVLYVSGYTKDEIVRKGRLDRGVRLLRKSFTQSELAHHVWHALGHPSETSRDGD